MGGMSRGVGREPVGAAIDLYGWKVPGIVRKVLANREVGRVEGSDPMGVNPAGGADPDHSYSLTSLFCASCWLASSMTVQYDVLRSASNISSASMSPVTRCKASSPLQSFS